MRNLKIATSLFILSVTLLSCNLKNEKESKKDGDLISNQMISAEVQDHKDVKKSQTNFYAYHTKINSGEAWEENSKTGEHADLVVQVNDAQIIFHRKSSYLPLWKTIKGEWYFEEIIERNGDGPEQRPDKNNIYSYVRLIHESADSIVVHWRYFPDFKLGHHALPIGGNVEFDGVVHEYFTIYPSGKVKRVIREGAKKLDDWNDPLNRSIQILQLDTDGIKELNRTKPGISHLNVSKIEGSPILKSDNDDPTRYWNFDDAMKEQKYEEKDVTYEAIEGTKCNIGGVKTVFKKGISGTALAFDGYNTKVTDSSLPFDPNTGGFTLEAWVAPGAYSICKWTAIAHQSVWEADIRDNIFQGKNWGKMQLGEKIKEGFFLGIDEFGHLGAFVVLNDEIAHVQSFESLPLYEWSHVALTFNKEGMLHLFINGELANFTNFSGKFEPADCNFMIGKNDESIEYVSKHVVRTYSTFPSPLGFEGLIDEVKYYEDAVFPNDMRELYNSINPNIQEVDMQKRTLPGEIGTSESFKAYYTNLKYHDLWDNLWREPEHPDIVVKFDLMPTSVVFWRGNRSPGWVTENNKWISDQSVELTDWHWENKSEGAQSCCEHMSDYQARHSHVRIIEDSEARKVIHWRYASIDVLYKHPNTCRQKDGWGVWTDEYLTIYPDGVGLRTVDSHGSKDYYHDPEGLDIGFHDTQFLSEAGTRPEDNIEPQSVTLVGEQDKIIELDWSEEHPSTNMISQAMWINLKSDYKVFEVFPPETKISVWAGEEKTSYSKYSAWNHYPVTQAPCDGRFAVKPDRLTHSALGAAVNIMNTGKMILYGFTNKKAESLIPLARSWNNAPEISGIKGGNTEGYEKSERAYIIHAEDDLLAFSVNASAESPIYNPCFIIDGWDSKARVSINGNKLSDEKIVRQGLVRDTEGQLRLIVWLNTESEKQTSFVFEK